MPYLSLFDQGRAQFLSDVEESRIKEKDIDGQRQLADFLSLRGTREAARDSAIALQSDAGKKYGSEKNIISKKWIDTLVSNIDNAIAVGNNLMAGAPETVSAAWFVVKLGLGAIQSNYTLYTLFGSGLTAMTEIMILIPHYDAMFDRRDKAGYKIDDMTQTLFRDIVKCYAAVLDFMFSIKRHIEASRATKIGHAFKDFFGLEVKKFKSKQDIVMTLKSKVLEASEAAFKSKVFDQMDDIQDALRSNLDGVAISHKEIMTSLQDLKATLKPKTRWDWLKQTFDGHVKSLDPYHNSVDMVSFLLSKKSKGTGTWIFEDEKYTAWLAGASDRLLCLSGVQGVGKSVIAATVIEELEKSLPSAGNSICYFACTTKDNDLADLEGDPAQKIKSTLMYQFYKLLADDDHREAPELLEEANNLFHTVKQTGRQRSIIGDGPEFVAPPFPETMAKLAKISKMDFILIIDGLDRLPKQDQLDLFGDLSTLACDHEKRCRVIAVCRPHQPFYAQALKSFPVLTIERQNEKDIEYVLDAALQAQQALTSQEREEAKQKVFDVARGSFAYVTDLAIPFLKQPFQRPLSTRLKALPEGMLDTYKQALKSMEPAYLDLLQTALTWSLYASQPVRIQEIMEAHSGIYLANVDLGDDEYMQHSVSELEIEQLEAASGPYLRNWRNVIGHWYSGPKDVDLVRQFCSSGEESLKHTPDHILCTNCGKDASYVSQLALPEKQVHLRLAISLLKHLNSRLFQKRYQLYVPDDEVPDLEPHADQRDDQKDMPSGSGESIVVLKQDVNAPFADAETRLDESTQADGPKEVAGSELSKSEPSEDQNCQVDRDDSRDSEDREDSLAREDEPTSEMQKMIDDNTWTLRYEIERWPFHVREAEKLWTYEERLQSSEWQEIILLLDRFALDTPKVFQQWCHTFNYTQPECALPSTSPLNAAACLGLQHWAEHLIKERGLDPNAVNDDCTPLLAIRPGADNRAILKFFLQQPGLDKNVLNGSDAFGFPVVHRWLMADANVETAQLLLEAGAEFTTPVGSDRATAMHALAWSIKDVETLELVMSAPGKPDINAQASNLNTPLHLLLRRDDITVQLVQAYLDRGANVNAEDCESAQPLEYACWRSRSEIALALLEHGVDNIDDGDDDEVTALHAACSVGDVDCVRALLKHGANINIKSSWGRTPLHSAAWTSEPSVVKVLIENGADLAIRDGHDRTPFWFACYAKNSSEKANLLLTALKENHAIDAINVPSKTGRTPLRLAATHGYVDIVTELVNMTKAAGLNISEMLDMQDTKHGNTALHRAALRGEHACVKVLLEHGANATLRNKDEKTATELASAQWQAGGATKYEQVILLCASKDLDRIKQDYDLPAIAATNGSVKVLEALANLGVSLNNADSFGWTPLLLAQRLKMTEVEHFLRSHAAWKVNLPSSWIKHAGVSDDFNLDQGVTSFTYTCDKRVCLTTNRPLPGNLDRYYYEVTINNPAQDVGEFIAHPRLAIGFSSLGGIAYTFPGWEAKKGVRNGHSWAYHGDDGWLVSSFTANSSYYTSGNFDEKFGPNDIVGVGVDLTTQTMWFTKNGKKLNFEHSHVNGRLFPIIGLIDSVSIETNFGSREFAWKDWLKSPHTSDPSIEPADTESA